MGTPKVESKILPAAAQESPGPTTNFKFRILGLLFCLLCPITLLCQTASGPTPTSLAWWAFHAKQKGQTSLQIGALQEGHDYTPPLSQTVAHSFVVQGIVRSLKVDHSDGFHIFQWYTVTPIKAGPLPTTHTTAISKDIPAAVGAVSGNDIIVRIRGGSANIDGVAITEIGPPQLVVGGTYLFFLDKTDAGFYELAFNTRAVELDEKGLINHTALGVSTFTRQLDKHNTFEDIEKLEVNTK
jgi:hypothetical protein